MKNPVCTVPKEILIVDDNPASLRLMADIIEGEGYRVRLASDGELAIRSAKIQPPALILLDIKMPGMDGYEVCRYLKNDEKTRSIPIVFLSALESEEEKVKAFQAGGVDFISKPIRAAEALARVSTHLALQQAQIDLEIRNTELEAARDTLEEKVNERSMELEQTNQRLHQQIDMYLQTLEALRESEAKYRRIVDTANEGIWVLGPNGTTALVNTRLTEILGYSQVEMNDRPITDFMLVEEIPDHLEKMKLRRQGLSENYERRFLSKIGRIVWMLVSSTPIFDEANHFQGSFGMFTDITKRKQAEESLHRLNRELQAISNCNLTLMRAEDEQALLNDICRIVCGEAGYCMAWVGYVDSNDRESIRPVAWAGITDGNLEQSDFFWADTEQGSNPSCIVIRSAESVCSQDSTTVSKTTPWRDEALQRGYCAGIALPLKNENINIFGALNIYSTEANAFTPDEVRLLEELSDNLAFGIMVLRARIERNRVEAALKESEAKTRSILDNISIGVALISPEMEILELNQRMHEWFPSIDSGQHPICYRTFNDPPREEPCDYCPTGKTLQDGLVHEATSQTPQEGGIRNYRIISSPLLNASGQVTAAIEMVEDITERLSLESQLQQAQKMESVGRLAGGIAHDFNNMLGVIIGHAELARNQMDPTQPLFTPLHEILKAAVRSADLTRQLLAFASKQTVAPKVLDLNEAVEGMLKMLRRLIGEDIDLVWLPASGLCPVKMDPSQIDQILANLCVNARDAIEDVGKVTIETHTVTCDEAYCANQLVFISGDFIMLAVSDDGLGMDKEIMDKIFEPFFTTKGIGKGTGLGLSTVYGIIKQNNGFINVYSEPGQGSTIKIYLPRHMDKTEQMRKESLVAPDAQGDETILLVEDEAAILKVARLMLENLGYRVLVASTPGEAITVVREYVGKINLLLTDVVMPEMNGRDLANKLISLSPGLKSLFMSGYTSNVIAHHSVLGDGINFIQKPFSRQALAVKVREVLDSK